MAYTFPRLQFDRSQYFSLNEAFHALGCFMFPDAWTGLEISSWPESSGETLREEKDRLNAQAEFKQRIATEIRMGLYSGGDQASYDALKKKLDIAQPEADHAKTAAHEFGRSYDNRIRDALAFERKQAVESLICNAIRKVDLKTYLGSGTVFGSMADWTNHKDFRVSFSHSYVVTPASPARRQKYRAYFLKRAFEQWAEPLQGDLSMYRKTPVEDDFVLWFKDLVSDFSAKKERLSRQMVLREYEEKFARVEELDRLEKKLDAVWELYAPNDWRKGGKPSKPSDV
ncbi:hypothetical protein [Pseudosulfitobacter sp. SM2401]|uniref:hypothetical protein n=1 Tax=Pseudosulfitobacter sp. SM2401 TaxID=3350098 RepID=UPI0036F26EE2